MHATTALAWPMLAQILITFVVCFVMGRLRFAAYGRGEVPLDRARLSGDAWPDRARQASNNFSNQFETPVLFYVLCLIAWHINATNIVMQALAWIYVLTRLVHAGVHLTSNDLRPRFGAYFVGLLCLIAMWIVIVLRLAAYGI
ncbi:hypothetical protein SAMN05216548_11338 [Faunimonas pinastri]|uniref:MAPEG family protein n=1 Tax=Faunimonas pinastri TaxID=1855383 RepID=A0A1H9MBK1_9HYPH|nr:MAPEG family protein [Faunimonas pinastri]SER20815.1 hypothetical protein SAMN05216548_11338 [Faunimonas pinastri]